MRTENKGSKKHMTKELLNIQKVTGIKIVINR